MENMEKGYKVIFLGESAVGKTTLIKISIGKIFDSESAPTLMASYFTKNFNYKKHNYAFCLWDTIGNEKYRSLTRMFYKDSKIVILVYDITSKKSFNALDYWYQEVKNELGEDIILAIVGNKSDLFLEEQVSLEEGQKYAEMKHAFFQLSSAKNEAQNFIDFLEKLFKEYIEKYLNKKNTNKKESKALNKKKLSKKKRGCC